MKWQVKQARGQWFGEVVSVGDSRFQNLRGARVAIVLTDNVNFRERRFEVDADWWHKPSFNELIDEHAVILMRRFEGFDDNGSAIVGDKVGMFRIANVTKDQNRLSFDLAERLEGAVQ